MAKTVMKKRTDLKVNFYVRTKVNDDHVLYLWDLIQHGTKLPPIVIDQNDGVIEGRHRLQAYEMDAIEDIECIVKHFETQADAIAYALASNVGGNLPPSKADIDHAVKLMLAEGLSGRAIVEKIAKLAPFPEKLIAEHVREVRGQLKKRAIERAVRAVAKGDITVADAARAESVDVEDVKAKIARSRDDSEKDPHEWKVIKSALSSTARGVSRTFGGAATKAIDGYNNGAVDEEHVQSVLDETERLLKKMLRHNRDHRERFVALAGKLNPKWVPKKRRDEKTDVVDPPEETEKGSPSTGGSHVSDVLRKMGLRS